MGIRSGIRSVPPSCCPGRYDCFHVISVTMQAPDFTKLRTCMTILVNHHLSRTVSEAPRLRDHVG